MNVGHEPRSKPHIFLKSVNHHRLRNDGKETWFHQEKDRRTVNLLILENGIGKSNKTLSEAESNRLRRVAEFHSHSNHGILNLARSF